MKPKPKKLGLPKKSAGMAASAVMSFAVMVSVANRQDPFQTLYLAAMSAGMAGFIGYWMGVILDKGDPVAAKKEKAAAAKKGKASSVRSAPDLAGEYEAITPVTGDETFLDDLSSSPSGAGDGDKGT